MKNLQPLNKSFRHSPSIFDQLMRQYHSLGFQKHQILKAWQLCGFNTFTFHEELIRISQEENQNLSEEDLMNSQMQLKKQLRDLEEKDLKQAIQLSIEDQNQQPQIEQQDRANKSVPVGLKNLGNTCYMNAMLQSLFNSLPFRQLIFSIDVKQNKTNAGLFLLQLQYLFVQLQESNSSFTNPIKLFEAFQQYKPDGMLIKGVQNDFNELQNAFLEAIEQALKDIEEEELKKSFCQMFYGESKEILTYKEKEQEVIKFTTTAFGSISIDAQDKDLEKGFLNSRILIIDEYETNSKEKVKAKVDQIILQPPKIMQFYINRVYYDPKQKLPCKNNAQFEFPSSLNINQFKASDPKSMSKELQRLDLEEQRVLDELRRYGTSKEDIDESFSKIIKLFKRGEGQLDQPLIIDDFQICDENTSNQQLISSQNMLFQLENYRNKFLKSIQLLTDRLEQIQSEKKLLLKSDQNMYHLTAVLMHDGGATSGHYYCYVLDKNDYKTWWKCNDSIVTKIEFAQVIKDATGVSRPQSNVSGLIYEQESWMKVQKLQITPKLLEQLEEERIKSQKTQDLQKVINRKTNIIQQISNCPLKACKSIDPLSKEFEIFSNFELFLSVNHPNVYKHSQTLTFIKQDLYQIKDQLCQPQNIEEYIQYFVTQSKLINQSIEKEQASLQDEFLKINSLLQQLPLKDLTQTNFQENVQLFFLILQQIPQKNYCLQLFKGLKDIFQIMLLKGCFLIDLSIQRQDINQGIQIAQQILNLITDNKIIDDIIVKQIQENLKSSADQAKLISKRQDNIDQFTKLKMKSKISIILKLLNFKSLEPNIQSLQNFQNNGLQLWMDQAFKIISTQKLLVQQDRLNDEADIYFQG
ncbi:unnamed protein product [Paramecium octaurelia]|uniref:Ubiquitin carboxyl-terminal hydrolase n=1 Tax=Paramecium octaurelia TaxID=43137 RepID=A0A8S1YGQ2_PAROT|nr:unnamed protein product [Paramecium octaurelia]